MLDAAQVCISPTGSKLSSTINGPLLDPGGHECLAGQGEQRGPLLLQQVRLDRGLTPEPPAEVRAAARLEVALSGSRPPRTAGTGTRKLRRAYPIRVSTCPFSLGRRTRQKWESNK